MKASGSSCRSQLPKCFPSSWSDEEHYEDLAEPRRLAQRKDMLMFEDRFRSMLQVHTGCICLLATYASDVLVLAHPCDPVVNSPSYTLNRKRSWLQFSH